MKFTVAVEWTMTGEFEVEAESLEQAINLVSEGDEPYHSLPDDGDYLDGSFSVNEEVTKEINE